MGDSSDLSPMGMVERRVVTSVSCGLVVKQEETTTSLLEFISQAVTILQVMGGAVRVEAGNIISSAFANPAMSETDAERAVLAALELLTARRANSQFTGLNLHIGIASGLVWARGGEFPNTTHIDAVMIQASSLREVAKPGTILVSEATRDFIKDLFEYAHGDPVILRNFSEPLRAFSVLRPSGEENRFGALRSQRLRFLGRSRELSQLAHHWRSAWQGRGQTAFITGDQGIGKSRLLCEFEHRLVPAPIARLRLFCSPNHSNSVLYPFVRLMERLCFFGRGDTVFVKVKKVKDFLASLGLARAEPIAVFSGLLGLPLEPDGLPPGISARKLRELTLQNFLTLIEAQVRQGPTFMIFEDLQWADPTSMVLVGLIVKRLRSSPLMLIATARPEFTPKWIEDGAILQMQLGPLTRSESAAFIELISNKHDVTTPLTDHIIECTGGIPLFVEELTKVFIESGIFRIGNFEVGSLRACLSALPISMHSALLSRLDRLEEGKTVARIAAILGRRFSHQVLEGVSGMDSASLNLGLARLIDAGLIFRRGAPPDADYLFKHVLVQEVAASTLSGSEKKKLHLRAANLLDSLARTQAVEPELIAHHLTEAGDNDAAARLWYKAGQCAIARSANIEAIEHLRAGLKCLRKIEPSMERDRRERQMLMAIGPALMAVHGYSAVESHNAFERAAELIDESTPVPERLHIICGLWNVRTGRSELYAALGLAEQFFDLAQAAGAGLVLGNCMLGQTLAAMGEFKRAQRHFLDVIQHFRDREAELNGVRFAADEHILALTYLGRVLWALGYPEQAQAATDEAVARAHAGSDAVSTAIALVGQLYMATHRTDADAAEKIDEAVAHCARYGLYLFEHWMLFNRGVLLARQGNPGAGIEAMRAAISAADARQSRQFRVFQLSCIAEAYLNIDAYRQALSVVDESLLLAEKSGERWSGAGARRVRAEILMKLGRGWEAQVEFDKALNLARQQSARLEELRIATAMVSHASNSEEAKIAVERLQSVYATFEEGHDLQDLQTAQRYLARNGGAEAPRS